MMRKQAITSSAVIFFLVLSALSMLQAYGGETEAPIRSKVARGVAALSEVSVDQSKYYPVARVVDGDTIDVEIDGVRVRVRIIGINTPETVDPRRPVECFGKEASAKAKELLEGKLVRLETDPTQGNYDKYQRLLAYVYLPDGTLFNKEMITEGYAYEYTYRLPYRHQSEFKLSERAAREGKRGLWAEGVCAR